TVIRLSRMIATRRSRDPNLAAAHTQLEDNFGRAFPGGERANLAMLRERHMMARHHAGVILANLRARGRRALARHAARDVTYLDPAWLDVITRSARPVILFTPHYGCFVSASLRIARDLGAHRRVNIFFDDPRDNPTTGMFAPLYTRFGGNVNVLYNSRRAVVAALRALKEGEVLTMMPDVYDVSGGYAAVPFFGGLTNAMTGTAFLACKTGALLVPVYCRPVQGLRCEVDVQPPIEPSAIPDFEQAVFETTAAIFGNMEAELRRHPEHWIYWDEFHRRFPAMTPLPGKGETWEEGADALFAELRRRAPVLEPLLDDLERELSEAHAGPL
ncbi:MAG TPA: lysophospholipid acyltransferase family protein, partial [Gammaproteobacteria bacterium]